MMTPLRTPSWIDCPGEAHSNAHIDNCGVCSPHWAHIPVCPDCKARLGRTKTGRLWRCLVGDCQSFGQAFDIATP